MEIQHISEFLSLVKVGNYFDAADSMHMSQSSLTKHIQKLEDELGAALFIRSSRSFQLSPYGKAFLKYAEQAVALQREALEEFQRIRAECGDSIAVAFEPLLERFGLLDLMLDIQKAHPGLTINATEADDPEETLVSGQCDFAFVQRNEIDNPEIADILYKRDELVAILPKEHPLSGAESVRVEQLKGERIILLKKTGEDIISATAELEKLCGEAGFSPNITLSASFSSTVMRLISQGEGISIMRRQLVSSLVPDVSVLALQPNIHFDIRLIYLRKRRLREPHHLFLEQVQNAGGNSSVH